MPQLLEEKNFEFPKYYTVNTLPPPPPASSGHFWRTGTKLPGCVWGVTPSISSGIPIQFSRANFENI